MPFLRIAKRRLADKLGSIATRGEGTQNLLCAYLGGAVLVGLLGNALLGWWWFDPAAAPRRRGGRGREDVESWRGEGCCATCWPPPLRRRAHRRREDIVPPAGGVVADEERGGVASEADRHHRADDHDCRDVAEPGGDSDEAPVPEPLHQVGDDPARGWVAHAELDDGVAEQRGNDPLR